MLLSAKGALTAAATFTAGALLVGSASAEERHVRAFDEVEFTEGVPGIHFGLLWGDWRAGPFAMLVRIEAGAKAPLHYHTANYNAVSIQGSWVHTSVDGVDHVVTPGSYAYPAANENHADRCRGPEDCLILVQMDGPNAFVVAE